jgi:hypothetical protein
VVPDGIQAFFQPAPDLFSQFNQLGPAGRALDQKDEAVAGKAEEPPMISRKGHSFSETSCMSRSPTSKP